MKIDYTLLEIIDNINIKKTPYIKKKYNDSTTYKNIDKDKDIKKILEIINNFKKIHKKKIHKKKIEHWGFKIPKPNNIIKNIAPSVVSMAKNTATGVVKQAVDTANNSKDAAKYASQGDFKKAGESSLKVAKTIVPIVGVAEKLVKGEKLDTNDFITIGTTFIPGGAVGGVVGKIIIKQALKEIVKPNSFANNLVNNKVSTKPVNVEVSTKPVNTEVTTKPVNTGESIVSTNPVNIGVTTKPVNTEVTTKPVNTGVTTKPVNTGVTTKSVNTEVTTKLVNTGVTTKSVNTETTKPVNTKTTKPVNNNVDKIISTVLTLIGLPGQIVARSIYKKGSIDKPYLFIFGIPPFSLIPSILMYTNNIKDGDNENPYDNKSFIGMILLFIVPITLHIIKGRFNDSEILNYSIKPLIQISYIFIIFIIYKIKYNRLCNKDSNIIALQYSVLIAPIILIFGKLISATIKYFICKYKIYRFTNIIKYDMVDKILKTDEHIVDLYLSSAISFICIYVMVNMYNSNNNNLKKTCDMKFSKNIIIASLLLNIIIPLIINNKDTNDIC